MAMFSQRKNFKRNQEQCSLNFTGLHSEIGTKEQAFVPETEGASQKLHMKLPWRKPSQSRRLYICLVPNIQVKGQEPAEEHGDVQPKEELQEKPGTV
ncbi:hypothetical protein OIU79_031061 [Salix purpurea]|uniref:Uncharacterized protein n=1 Tax=Salix purpurea TaxID=77065 RepID=A0A9Q0V9W5_SALPP|nr:hypothetical protein OIU79_031061 [Salix purpurea]